MPGLVLCGRRWSIASDDIFIPAIIMFVFHLIGSIGLIAVVSIVKFDSKVDCSVSMYEYLIGFLITILMAILIELMALFVSCRGSVLDSRPRKFLQQIIYSRLILLLVEMSFIICGIYYLIKFKNVCLTKRSDKIMRQALVVVVVGSTSLIFILLLSISCVYDRAGKSFYRLKLFESNYRKNPSKLSASERHLKHRRTLDLYHENWKFRCKFLCCCIKESKNKTAFASIAETLSCFFYKYDVVPSDVLAGLLLLRDKQKLHRNNNLTIKSKGIFDYLSGVPVTESTIFFNINEPENLKLYKDLIYFIDFAAASYGWPLYAYSSHCACLKLLPNIKNCMCPRKFLGYNNKLAKKINTFNSEEYLQIENDNCCFCYYDALIKQLPEMTRSNQSLENIIKKQKHKNHIKIIHANFSSDVAKPSFFVAIDFLKKKVVITVRGTENLRDSITDMQWRAVSLPNIESSLEWFGHEGIVKAASYLKEELESREILKKAFDFDLSKNTDKYDLLLVGHSLGAGVAAILSIILKSEYPGLKCYSYSPPGGLLSRPCMEATKEFITTVILGKDMVPRLGMVQLEKLRNEVMEALKHTTKPKWQILSTLCCYKCNSVKQANETLEIKDNKQNEIELVSNSNGQTSSNEQYTRKFSELSIDNKLRTSRVASVTSDTADLVSNKKIDTNVCISSPLPQVSSSTKNLPRLYPPGRILHLVRKYPRTSLELNELNQSTDTNRLDETNELKISKNFKDFIQNKSNNSTLVSPIYQVIETDNKDFNELLISPRMLQDHMPDNLIKCMRAVLDEPAPRKPPRLKKNDLENSSDENDDDFTNEVSAKYAKIGNIRNCLGTTSSFIPFCRDRTENNQENQPSKNSMFYGLKKSQLMKKYSFYMSSNRAKTNTCEKNQNERRFKSMSMCADQRLEYAAPLAKPESLTDLTNETKDNQQVPEIFQENGMFNNLNRKEFFYEPNQFYSRNDREQQQQLRPPRLEEDELKSNLAWWPYIESNSTIETNPNKNLNNSSNCSNNSNGNKMHINIHLNDNEYYEEDDVEDMQRAVQNLLENRMSTSTPRADLIINGNMGNQITSTSPLINKNKSNNKYIQINSTNKGFFSNKAVETSSNLFEQEQAYANEMVNEQSQTVENEVDNENSFDFKLNEDVSNSILHYLSNTTSSSTHLNKLISDLKLNNSSSDLNVASSSFLTNTSSRDNSNLDTSIDNRTSSDFFKNNNQSSSLSLSFSNNSNTNNNNNIDANLNNPSNLISGKNAFVGDGDSNNNSKNTTSNNNSFNTSNNVNNLITNYNYFKNDDSINYSSILNILKPQSKDYILCFDTSSIDQSSSMASNDALNSLNLVHLSSLNNIDSHLNKGTNGEERNEVKNLSFLNTSSLSNNSISLDQTARANATDDQEKRKHMNVEIIAEINKTKLSTIKQIDYPDSGVDTSRTLSPYAFNVNNSNQIDNEIKEKKQIQFI